MTATSYYYSQGRRIPVTRLRIARVARAGENRDLPEVSGWRSVPLGVRGYQLLVWVQAMGDRALHEARLEDLAEPLLRADRELADAYGTDLTSDERALDERLGGETTPVLVSEGGGLLLPTGEVVASFPAGTSRAEVDRLVHGLGAVVTRAVPLLPDTFVLQQPGSDGLDLAGALVESGRVRYASPNFIEEMPQRATAPLPPNAGFARQWHLRNTGQRGARPGADVHAVEAWAITTGSPEIVICILDSGVESRHEAFSAAGKLTAGFDFQDEDVLADPTATAAHGTSCAGVAAAPWGAGDVVGVAPGCRIMPIRRASLSEHLRMAEAFAWAAANGADVISCSFGHDNRPWVLPDVVRDALDQAANQGRGGRGCVIVWAAGNGDEPIDSDEWASYPAVIAVAASNDQDVRSSYSDFGAAVHVCAPSSDWGHNGITTTTTTALGRYTEGFGGTSSAAPLVAGVVALVLSLNPNLSAGDVKDLLRRATDQIDVAGGAYDSRGHSDWYGYGRINAHKALGAIDVLAEAVRATPVERRVPALHGLAAKYLEPLPVGRGLLDALRSNRVRILRLLVGDAAFRIACVQILAAAADAYDALERGAPVALPKQVWSAVDAVVSRLRGDDEPLRTQPSVNGEERVMTAARQYRATDYGRGGQGGTASSAPERGWMSHTAVGWLVAKLREDPGYLERLKESELEDGEERNLERAGGPDGDVEAALRRLAASMGRGTTPAGGDGRRGDVSTAPTIDSLAQFVEAVSVGALRALDAREQAADGDRSLTSPIRATLGLIYDAVRGVGHQV